MNELITTFRIEWVQFVAQLVNFIVAAGLIWLLIGRPLSKTLDSRKAIIEKGIENGIHSETLLSQARTDAEMAREQAKKDALAIVADASHKAAEYVADAEHRAFVIEQKLVEDAKDRAEEVFVSELHGQKNQLVDTLIQTASALLKSKLADDEAHKSFILAQLPTKTTQ